MNLDTLMLELAQAIGGVHKHRGDFWILEVPMGPGESCIIFFRVNTVHGASGTERFLVMFTQIGLYARGTSMASFLHFEHLLKTNADLRHSRTALFGERIVLLAAAHEEISEDILLEMVHEVVHAGVRLRSELRQL